uniref:restriction endonuclease subunit S n=1 Tax=uncultured Parvimonas sp. TaxID=747372 RepID=UPI0025916001
MSLEFKYCKINDIGEVVSGGTPSTSKNEYWYGDIGWITPKDLSSYDDIYISRGERNISSEGLNNSSAKLVPKNTVLMTSRAPIGYIAIANNELSTNQGFKSLICNEKICHYKYFYYWLKLNIKYIINNSNGSTFKEISGGTFKNLELSLPSLNEQKAISSVLWTIDEKISVLKRINKNLEEQLLRIFDSWFLKFELSNEFSDSKLGLIPKGWKIDYLGSKKSCSIIKSGIDEFDNSKIYIATADVDNSIITSNDTLITMDDKPSRANMQPISNSIWFAKMIDSKKLIMVDEYCNDLLNNYIFSTGFCGLKCVDKYFYYLWTFLLTDVFDVMKNNFCTGTTMQAINNKDTKLIEFVLPDDKTITQFNSIAKPMFKKIYYNNLEIKKLQRLRDALLPKLMSGEIDVS